MGLVSLFARRRKIPFSHQSPIHGRSSAKLCQRNTVFAVCLPCDLRTDFRASSTTCGRDAADHVLVHLNHNFVGPADYMLRTRASACEKPGLHPARFSAMSTVGNPTLTASPGQVGRKVVGEDLWLWVIVELRPLQAPMSTLVRHMALPYLHRSTRHQFMSV